MERGVCLYKRCFTVFEKDNKKDTVSLPVNLNPGAVLISNVSLGNTNSEIISVKVDSETNASYGYGYGYGYVESGYGYDYGYSLGYGYGYSYPSDTAIVYDISWKAHETGTYKVSLIVTVVDSNGNEKNFTTQHTINIQQVETTQTSPAVPLPFANLKASPSTIERTVNAGDTIEVTLTLSNTGNEELRNVRVSSSGEISSWITFDKTAITRIAPGNSVNIVATIAVPADVSQGKYTGDIEITSDNAQTKHVPVTIIVVSGAQKPTAPTIEETVYKTVKRFVPNTTIQIELPKDKVEEVDVVSIAAKLPREVEAKVVVSKVVSLPNFIPKPKVRDIYKVVNITFEDYTTGSKLEPSAYIEFRISKNWLNEKGYRPEDVVLMKYDNEWKELPTTVVNGDANYYYYKAKTGEFSIFAISVKPANITTTPTHEENVSVTQERGLSIWVKVTIIAIVLVFAIGLIAVFVKKTKKAKKKR